MHRHTHKHARAHTQTHLVLNPLSGVPILAQPHYLQISGGVGGGGTNCWSITRMMPSPEMVSNDRFASHHIVSLWHRIASHRIAPHRIVNAVHWIASHRIASPCITHTQHRLYITSYRIEPHRSASHHIVSLWHRIASHRIASYPFATHHTLIVSYRTHCPCNHILPHRIGLLYIANWPCVFKKSSTAVWHVCTFSGASAPFDPAHA